MGKFCVIARKRTLLVSFIFAIPQLRAQGLFFDSAGVKIHYTVEGKGEPVLLIHGFGQDGKSVRHIANALRDAFQIISIDISGHGQSDKPHEASAYGKEMAESWSRERESGYCSTGSIPKAHHRLRRILL